MSKKGLTTSVLGSHLGFDVPAVVRRGSPPLQAVSDDLGEPAEQSRAVTESSAPEAPSEQPREAATEREAVASVRSDIMRKQAPAVAPAADELEEHDADEPDLEPEHDARRAPAGVSRRKQPAKVESRSSVYRVGTQRAPYERADGTKTEKAGFTAPHGFKEEINLFCLTHRLGTTSEWIVATLRKEMERTRRRS
jgi:hypothetical protein